MYILGMLGFKKKEERKGGWGGGTLKRPDTVVVGMCMLGMLGFKKEKEKGGRGRHSQKA